MDRTTNISSSLTEHLVTQETEHHQSINQETDKEEDIETYCKPGPTSTSDTITRAIRPTDT